MLLLVPNRVDACLQIANTSIFLYSAATSPSLCIDGFDGSSDVLHHEIDWNRYLFRFFQLMTFNICFFSSYFLSVWRHRTVQLNRFDLVYFIFSTIHWRMTKDGIELQLHRSWTLILNPGESIELQIYWICYDMPAICSICCNCPMPSVVDIGPKYEKENTRHTQAQRIRTWNACCMWECKKKKKARNNAMQCNVM